MFFSRRIYREEGGRERRRVAPAWGGGREEEREAGVAQGLKVSKSASLELLFVSSRESFEKESNSAALWRQPEWKVVGLRQRK